MPIKSTAAAGYAGTELQLQQASRLARSEVIVLAASLWHPRALHPLTANPCQAEHAVCTNSWIQNRKVIIYSAAHARKFEGLPSPAKEMAAAASKYRIKVRPSALCRSFPAAAAHLALGSSPKGWSWALFLVCLSPPLR